MSVSTQMKPGLISRPDLLDKKSPEGIEAFEIHISDDTPSCHVSMEAQVFTPDSRYFLLHYGEGVQSFNRFKPGRGYHLCDLTTGETTPVAMERGAIAPSFSPDGKYFYYFIDNSTPGAGNITLMRRSWHGGDPDIITVLDHNIPGTPFRPSLPNPLSTISSDGKRLAISFFLGDGEHAGGSFGLVVFDLVSGNSNLILYGPSWSNIHAQYSRSLDPRESRDLLIQENHGGLISANGARKLGPGEWGADIHVVRDDGQNLRNLPWGRTGEHWCSGHQCWRGRLPWAIGSIVQGTREALSEKNCEIHLVESQPIDHWGHQGENTPDGSQNRLTRDFVPSHFNHLACDLSGSRLVADYRPSWDPEISMRDAMYLMELGEPGAEAAKSITYLLSSGSSWQASAHVHPFFSPDGKTILFNSDESGMTKAYIIKELPPTA